MPEPPPWRNLSSIQIETSCSQVQSVQAKLSITEIRPRNYLFTYIEHLASTMALIITLFRKEEVSVKETIISPSFTFIGPKNGNPSEAYRHTKKMHLIF